MTDISAAIGIEQLKKIDSLLNEKVNIAEKYSMAFSTISTIESPFVPEYVTRPSWYMYAITIDPKMQKFLLDYLEEKRIETRLSFPPVHIQPYYQNKFCFDLNSFPHALKSFKSFIDIPIWADMGIENQKFVIDKILEAIKLFNAR